MSRSKMPSVSEQRVKSEVTLLLQNIYDLFAAEEAMTQETTSGETTS